MAFEGWAQSNVMKDHLAINKVMIIHLLLSIQELIICHHTRGCNIIGSSHVLLIEMEY